MAKIFQLLAPIIAAAIRGTEVDEFNADGFNALFATASTELAQPSSNSSSSSRLSAPTSTKSDETIIAEAFQFRKKSDIPISSLSKSFERAR